MAVANVPSHASSVKRRAAAGRFPEYMRAGGGSSRSSCRSAFEELPQPAVRLRLALCPATSRLRLHC